MLLFDGVTEDSARREHRKTIKAAGLRPDYTMHNARHSFAVRWMKNGANPQDIANNLGHCNGSQVITRYGKYRVTLTDLAETRRHLRLAK